MNRLFFAALLDAVLLLAAPAALAQQVPQVLGYQGRVAVAGVNFDGNGQFKFALVNAVTGDLLWSNDGSLGNNVTPNAFVSLNVTKGLYSVRLGDTTLANMTAMPAGVFSNTDVRLRVWFNDGTANGFQLLAPDQRLSSVAYAIVAGTAQTVAPGAVGSAQLANGLTLGGTITLSGGVNLPPTSSASVGIIQQGGVPLIHTFGGVSNFFAGSGAGNFMMTGTSNTALGSSALVANTTGANNVASGASALFSNTTGNGNTASGNSALFANTTGVNNVAIGINALLSNTTGNTNVAAGAGALSSNTTGSANTASGVGTLFFNTSGHTNTASGANALYANTTGNDNTASGSSALYSNLTGANNTANGVNALFSNTTGVANTASGGSALFANTTGFNNMASGTNALFSNTTGSGNTASGANALYSSTTGAGNTGSGGSALNFNTTGDNNTANGVVALFSNTTGSDNTASGARALYFNTTGIGNAASGAGALYSNTTGNNNAASGDGALQSNTTGGGNSALGGSALFANTTGTNNIAVGAGAGNALTTGSYNIDIGHPGAASEANTTRLGTAGTQTRAFIAGIRGITTGVNNGVTVLIDGNGQLGTVSSSRRYKEDIADMGDASARLQALRPVTFRYKQPYEDGEKPIQYGLIAEEVAAVFPELAVLNTEGQPETVKYQDLAPLLLNEVQKMRVAAEQQEERVKALSVQVEELQALLHKSGKTAPKPRRKAP